MNLFGRATPKPAIVTPTVAPEPPWPELHQVAITHHEVWRYLAFYVAQMSEHIIEKNLIPNQAMDYVDRFQFFWKLYDYSKAYAEEPSSGFAKPEKIMVDLTNSEIYVLMRAAHKDLGAQLERYNGDCKTSIARLSELAALVKPEPPRSYSDEG